MKNRSLRRDSSGQVIVITALLVAMVLLSTAIYVIETEKDVPTVGADTNNVFLSYEQGARSTLISALANITNGGNPDVLAADLNMLDSAVTSQSYQSIMQMVFTPLSQAPYQNGIWVSWGTNGEGTSSAIVTLSLNSTGASSISSSECTLTVTSQVNLSVNSIQVNGTSNQVNLRVEVQNEGKPALAQSFKFYYEDAMSAGNWTQVTSPSLTDYGDGTYTVTFDAQTLQPGDPLVASVLCQDQRGILVCSNVTCTNA